jgi:hypothetical protein
MTTLPGALVRGGGSIQVLPRLERAGDVESTISATLLVG